MLMLVTGLVPWNWICTLQVRLGLWLRPGTRDFLAVKQRSKPTSNTLPEGMKYGDIWGYIHIYNLCVWLNGIYGMQAVDILSDIPMLYDNNLQWYSDVILYQPKTKMPKNETSLPWDTAIDLSSTLKIWWVYQCLWKIYNNLTVTSVERWRM